MIASVKAGGTISEPLRHAKVFPPMVGAHGRLGEETGALDAMLTKIADFYEDEVAAAVKALTSILEPAMIILVGGIVGVIVISMYLPLFKVYDSDQVAPWGTRRGSLVAAMVTRCRSSPKPSAPICPTLRAAPDPILAEMEEHGARENIPIVVPETGALLHVVALAAGARTIVEVGTAIGVSTLYLARALPDDGRSCRSRSTSERHAAATDYLRPRRAGRQGGPAPPGRPRGARVRSKRSSTWRSSTGSRPSTATTSTLLLPRLRRGGVLAVDNVLMSGTVAEGRSDGHWTDEQIATARAFNERLLATTSSSPP